MVFIKLVAFDKCDVAVVQIPPFRKPPDIVLWGNRYFLYTGVVDEGRPVFREGLCFAVPAA